MSEATLTVKTGGRTLTVRMNYVDAPGAAALVVDAMAVEAHRRLGEAEEGK